MDFKQTKIILVIIAFFFSSFLLASDWELKKDKDGIAVYTRDVPNSRFKESKAEAEFNTSLSTALIVIEDVESYPKWVPDVREMKLLAKINANESIVYEHQRTPLLVKDRDCILRVTGTNDPLTNIATLQITSLSDYLPRRKGIVRLEKVTASWTFIPSTDKRTVRIIYQMHNEPGGNISPWMSNGYIVKRAFVIFTNLRKMVQSPKFLMSSKKN